jgi:hypothetical protein
MKKLILTITTVVFIFSSTFAQTKVVVVKSNKREITRGANPNIKQDVPATDMEQAKPAGYKSELPRGANFSALTRAKHIGVRGENTNIKKDEPTKDVEQVRPAYNKVKQVAVKKATANKMRGASTNIKNDEPTIDLEIAKPANYESPNTKGTTVKQVNRKTAVKMRGANPNIKTDVPLIDIEQPKSH